MTRRLLFVLGPAALVAACSGLFLDNGNNWPCEYAKGPGLRDAACIAGDVCGVDDLCHRYVYEGPRFEGPASVPSFGAGSAQGKKLHPLILDEPLTFVMRELPFNSRHDAIAALTASGTVAGLTAQGQVGEAPVPSLANFTWAQAYEGPVLDGSMTRSQVLVRDPSGVLLGDLRPGDGARVPIAAGAHVRFIDAPRSGVLRESPWSMPLVWSDTEVGFVLPIPNPGVNNPRWALLPLPAFVPVAAAVHDFAGLTQPGQLWVAALTDEALHLAEVSRVDGGFQSVDAGLLALPTLSDGVTGGALRSDRDGRVLAAFRATRVPGRGEVSTVSTWQISAGANGPELTQPWPDCAPCRLGEEARFASVSVATGAPVVEVACAMPLLETFRMVRVVGSVALSPLESCRTERFEPPFDISRINGTRSLDGGLSPVTWSHQVGLLAGGKEGQLWFGETLSGMQPLFLDRTPSDVAPFQIVDSSDSSRVVGSTLVALAGDQLSVLETSLLVAADAGQRVNGFRRFDQRQLGVSDDEHLMAFVHQTPGWGVTSSGDVVKTLVGLGTVTTRSGPRLVKANGEPILSSIGGEAFSVEGVLQSFFVAADDGVYFVRNPRRFLDAGAGAPVETLTPELTPEPSVPIRSLALERTPLGTDGVNRARGYLVTSRNVYAWQLAGTPARWSATQLLLGGGEPMEVWFDAPLSALGRVGYRDGQVFSLPGGFLLAEPLPNEGRVDGGPPPQVLDFENLGGWPVAYATNGLFVAGWDRNADGRLQNRFPDGGINRPMTWRRVTLPDGGEPWSSPSLRTRPGKLFTAIDPVLPGADAGLPDGGLQPHRLLLFLDDQVLQVAEHLRK